MKPRCLLLLTVLLASAGLRAAERIPPAPQRYFNDYAGVVDRNHEDRLNRQLEEFERATSNQLLVVIYPHMESDAPVADYTVRVAQAWKAGQQGRNNGAVLFAFMREHQLYLQVGYGLEGAIPDALAKRIIEREIVPRFRAGDIDGGMSAAVTAMIAAARGEYKGTGRTAGDRIRPATSFGSKLTGIAIICFVMLGFFAVMILVARQIIRVARNPLILLNPSRRVGSTPWIGSSRGRSSSSWGGGGNFSGGGGSFGGGGAGGKW